MSSKERDPRSDNADSGSEPKEFNTPAEIREAILHEREEYNQVASLERFDAFYNRWKAYFPDRRTFCRVLGIVDPEYIGSFQEALAESYKESLVDRFQGNPDGEIFEQEIFMIEREYKVRIKTSVLPMSQIGFAKVTSLYIDLSFDLLRRLENDRYQPLLQKIMNTLLRFEMQIGKRVKKDGSF